MDCPASASDPLKVILNGVSSSVLNDWLFAIGFTLIVFTVTVWLSEIFVVSEVPVAVLTTVCVPPTEPAVIDLV